MKQILLIVDVQVGFVGEEQQPVVDGVKNLLEKVSFDDVVFTRFINEPDGLFISQLNWADMQGGPEIEIVPELRPYAKQVFDKSTYSALTPSLLEHLKQTQPDVVYVAGLETDACVMQTSLSLFDAGYHVKVLGDLVHTGAGSQIHKAGLAMLRRNIGKGNVVSSTSLHSV